MKKSVFWVAVVFLIISYAGGPPLWSDVAAADAGAGSNDAAQGEQAPEGAAMFTPISRSNEEETETVFSRTVRAAMGQLVEIPFRGEGWVYLGELAARRGIVFDSRRLDPEGQSFIFRTEAAGTYALKFFRQDFVRDFILHDRVQIIVGEAPDTAGIGWFNPPLERSRVTAEPRWPSALEEAELTRRGGRAAALSEKPASPSGGTGAGTGTGSAGTTAPSPSATPPAQSPTVSTPSAPPAAQPPAVSTSSTPAARPSSSPAVSTPPTVPLPPVPETDPAAAVSDAAPRSGSPAEPLAENFLQKAKEEFDAGRIAQAISALDQYRERYPQGNDEIWWLYGQFYEANSPSRDILTSMDYYRRLLREYPQSGHYTEARRRITYLERYYIFNN